MKKIGLTLGILIITGLIFGGCSFAEEGILKVASLEGEVFVKRAGQDEWVEVKEGAILYKDDMIKSSDKSTAYLEYVGSTKDKGFNLRPNSTLIIGDFLKRPR